MSAAATTGDAGPGGDKGAGPRLRIVAPPQGEDAAAEAAPAPAGRGEPGEPSAEFLRLIPYEFARRHLILSRGVDAAAGPAAERLLVGASTPPAAVFNVGVRLGRPVAAEAAPDPEALAAAIDAAYARAQRARDGERASPADGLPPAGGAGSDAAPAVAIEGAGDVEHELAATLREAQADLLNLEGKAPAVRLVDLILFEAVRRGASDVHVQPARDRTLVRYRLDGALRTARELPAGVAGAVVSRLKVMARLDVAERRAPQDGRAAVTVGGSAAAGDGGGLVRPGRRVDLRVSTLPSTYGERVVLRVLDPSRSPHLASFAALGMPPAVERRYLEQAGRTSGIVLSTGPTGSGKTTTLYATLSWISSSNAGGTRRGCELNMITVEDPVEYDLSEAGLSVSQTQVDVKKGVTFAAGLRHILRQDPDVIMVGEVRDEETARIAVQASLTGHLVLSTLHTGDAASAVARLIDLSVEPFLVASSLSAVLAQRLVRRTHRGCAGAGCPECSGTGYRGRTGVFELLVMDPALRGLVMGRGAARGRKAAAPGGGGGPPAPPPPRRDGHAGRGGGGAGAGRGDHAPGAGPRGGGGGRGGPGVSGGPVTIPRLACGALLAGAAAWALWPLRPAAALAAAASPQGPAVAPAAMTPPAKLDLNAFAAPLWVAPPPPPAPPAPPPPPPPLKLQLVAVVRDAGDVGVAGALRALVYDPELDRVLTLGPGDAAGGGRTVVRVEPAALVLREGTAERRLSLDATPQPGTGGAP